MKFKALSLISVLVYSLVLPCVAFSQTGVSEQSALPEDFHQNEYLRQYKWDVTVLSECSTDGSNVTAVATGQHLEVTPPTSSSGSHFKGFLSKWKYILTDSYVSAEVSQVADGRANTILAAVNDCDNWYRIKVEDTGSGKQIYFQDKVSATLNSSNISYSSTNHRYWRIRHDPSNDNIVYETSADRKSWTEQRRITRQLSLTAMRFEMSAGTPTAVASPGQAKFDNFLFDWNSDEPQLPRVFLDTAYPTNTGTVHNVSTSTQLQTALNQATYGDTIMVDPNGTYNSDFYLPDRGSNPNNKWIIVRSASTQFDYTGAVPPGTRVSTTSAMPKLISQTNNTPTISIKTSAHHYRLVGLDIGASSSVTTMTVLVTPEDGTTGSLSTMVSDIVLDRCYVHGNDYTLGNFRRGVAFSGKRMAVIDSYVSNFHDGGDSQAISGWSGAGPFKIVNNYLEAASENVMFGGEDPGITNLVPTDIEIQRNYFTKRLSWRNVIGGIKNLLEIKAARRILIANNIFETTWQGGQSTAIAIKAVNQNRNCPLCITEHLTFFNNIVHSAPNAVFLTGEESGTQGANEPPASDPNHIKFENSLFYDIGSQWGAVSGTCDSCDNAYSFYGGNIADVKIIHTVSEGRYHTVYTAVSAGENHPNFTFRDNIVERGYYGFGVNGEGLTTLNTSLFPWTWRKNVLVNNSDGLSQEETDATLRSRYPCPSPSPSPCSTPETYIASNWDDNTDANDVKFAVSTEAGRRSSGNHRLASNSPYLNAGSDLKDIGIDQDALDAGTRGARNGVWNRKPFDFDLDGRADIAVWRPGNGTWYIIQSNGSVASQQFGTSGDVPVPGDYDGGGKTDLAVFRPSNSTWYIQRSGDGVTYGNVFGLSTDKLVPADYDGDGRTDVAVFRPSNNTWYISKSSDGSLQSQSWGLNTDKLVPADYDGDGKADIAVFRPSNSAWYILRSSDGGTTTTTWGLSSDIPVPADYDGDGKADVAVWRPSNGTWYVFQSSTNTSRSDTWGASGDKPQPRDFDGNHKADYAVWRPSTGTWYIYKNLDNSSVIQSWGLSTDVAVSSEYLIE